jgi:molecular chaperone HscB
LVAVDNAADSGDTSEKDAAKDGMVELLNKRSYLRDLVRDVNEALE